MPYSREDDWARKFKMRSAGMFSTPSYWGVGEPFDDSLSGEPTASQLAAARSATVGSLVSLGLPCGWLACGVRYRQIRGAFSVETRYSEKHVNDLYRETLALP